MSRPESGFARRRRTGNKFILYSFGADFDDDGGTLSKLGEGEKGGDQVFWPVQESNDYSEAIAETKTSQTDNLSIPVR